MYIAGRLRTASRPSRTLILSARVVVDVGAVAVPVDRVHGIAGSARLFVRMSGVGSVCSMCRVRRSDQTRIGMMT